MSFRRPNGSRLGALPLSVVRCEATTVPAGSVVERSFKEALGHFR